MMSYGLSEVCAFVAVEIGCDASIDASIPTAGRSSEDEGDVGLDVVVAAVVAL